MNALVLLNTPQGMCSRHSERAKHSRRPVAGLVVSERAVFVVAKDASLLQAALPAVTGRAQARPKIQSEGSLSEVFPPEAVVNHLGSREPSF
jgi:hypothetical protein